MIQNKLCVTWRDVTKHFLKQLPNNLKKCNFRDRYSLYPRWLAVMRWPYKYNKKELTFWKRTLWFVNFLYNAFNSFFNRFAKLKAKGRCRWNLVGSLGPWGHRAPSSSSVLRKGSFSGNSYYLLWVSPSPPHAQKIWKYRWFHAKSTPCWLAPTILAEIWWI